MQQEQSGEEIRINAIHALRPTGEVKRISYNGSSALYEVYAVPLNHLIYNAHNGRIRSLTLSYESQYGILDPQKKEDELVIEQFLYDSAKSRNERTIESLETAGQQEVGIITKDGVIIDGNRRAMLLNLINRRNGEDRPFKTVVLPHKLKDNRQEIITLETSYQMGVDSKVDYNPIEKYIRCKELREYYSVEEIGHKMAESAKQVNEWLNILDLMEEYLQHLGTPGTYRRLEKREGHFVDLHKYLKTYQSSSGKQTADWEYNDEDLKELKEAYFTYIRLGIPVASTRVIARPVNKNGLFCYGDVWQEFVHDYRAIVDKSEDVDISIVKSQFQDVSTNELIDKVDKKWKEAVAEDLDENLFYYESVLGDKMKKLEPLRLLKRAKSTLFQVDLETLGQSMDDEKRQLIYDIDERMISLKELC
jgi:hypothetical protein